jgi:hypothetical protein
MHGAAVKLTTAKALDDARLCAIPAPQASRRIASMNLSFAFSSINNYLSE